MTKRIYPIFITLLCVFILNTLSSCHRHTDAYNPYLHMKVKPNEQQLKDDKAAIARSNKGVKKARNKTHKRLYGTPEK